MDKCMCRFSHQFIVPHHHFSKRASQARGLQFLMSNSCSFQLEQHFLENTGPLKQAWQQAQCKLLTLKKKSQWQN